MSGLWVGAVFAAQDARAARLRRQLRAARRELAVARRAQSDRNPRAFAVSALGWALTVVVVLGAVSVLRGGR